MNSSGTDTPDAERDAAQAKAQRERKEPSVSRPGGFENDPDDPTNPNETIHRTRESSLNPRRADKGKPNAR
jgi:hypothetical protein